MGQTDIKHFEGGYRRARELREVPSDGLFIEVVRFARVNDESVRLKPLETIQDGG